MIRLNNKSQLIVLLFITAFGAYFRFDELTFKPLFVDEALFGLWVRHDMPMQEWLPILLTRLVPSNGEFALRFLFALSGTLTIPAIYYSVKENKLLASLIVAIFPLFIFWSRMARPYAMAGLFIVLGWRYYWAYIPALLCTPISLIGIKVVKQKWYVLAGAVVAAIIFFFIRPDTERFTNSEGLNMLTYSARFWYLPALTLLLYVFNYKIRSLQLAITIITVFLFISTVQEIKISNDIAWYKREVRFADWNIAPKDLDFVTNVPPYWYYSGTKAIYLRYDHAEEFGDRLEQGDTLKIGVDYLVNYWLSNSFFNNSYTLWREDRDYPIQEFLRRYIRYILFAEKVMLIKAYKEGNNIIMEKL